MYPARPAAGRAVGALPPRGLRGGPRSLPAAPDLVRILPVTRPGMPTLVLGAAALALSLFAALCASLGWRAALGAPLTHTYRYTDETGAWDGIECPEKGRDFAVVERAFESWKRREGRPAARLHRTFRPEREGFLGLAGFHGTGHPRWSLPFRERAAPR